MWLRLDECEEVVRADWNGASGGSTNSILQQKIRHCRVAATKTRTTAIHAELEELREREELLWKQHGKTQWLKERDRNTVYFHHRASSRPSSHVINENLSTVAPMVSPEKNAMLLLPFTPDEVKRALHQMYPYKSPGPDGMPPIFYQRFWSIIGTDVVACVLEFLHSHKAPQSFNSHLVLIPKCDKPEVVSHFRHISLCNVIYKIASKIIANRLKPLIPAIISETQSAFVPGQLITDNVLIAYVINHFLVVFSRMIQHEEARCALQGVAVSRTGPGKNIEQTSRDELGHILGVTVVDKYEKYLGLPTVIGRTKRAVFDHIKSRVWNKMQHWSTKLLSQAGRTVLLKAVIQAIPAYVMSIFRILDTLLGKLRA
ncbi:UNVERIFIED_CONTAM: hypothetical protein Slati_2984400 [Sesamum latifolium]|uniref:Reverse transcriptase domain-containing protein n=1 Tax=Sesamum latifolium TaxID=2727402 RepID=A0AAW2VK33_9LAMI